MFGNANKNPLRGQSIYDVAARLPTEGPGKMSPNELPLRVIVRDGITYSLDNRTLTAYVLAGVKPTNLIDLTGDPRLEAQLTSRLTQIVKKGGTPGPGFVPILRGD